MYLPDNILSVLAEIHGIHVHDHRTVSGGSINRAYLISTNRGRFFLKYNSSAPDDFFDKEVHGLLMLKAAQTSLRIPDVIAAGNPEEGIPPFLLLEYIEEGRGGNSFNFGAELAKLHRTRGEYFGLDTDNYIGSLRQHNGKYDGWINFFREKRIEPQLKLAYNNGRLSKSLDTNWKRLAKALDQIIPPCDPCLLHGDLWGGNYLFDTNGNAVLIDPAVYYGHPEVDLAFTRMFGGFSNDFYRGYESVSSLEPGFQERVPLFNMYPLLVHVNLFGGHYVSQFESFLRSF
jgi:protein-ribulosamine 3-kinase